MSKKTQPAKPQRGRPQPAKSQPAERRYERIFLPKGMTVAWYGGGRQDISRVKTLSQGGLFIVGSNTLPLGTELKLVFEVPGGVVKADAVVRNIAIGEGMGVEFTKLSPEGGALLEALLKRLLR